MSNRIEVKQNDTRPPVEATLLDAEDDPIDLTDADEVRFQAESGDSDETVVDGACEIVNAGEGKVRYEWEAADTERAGDLRAEFDIAFSDGSRLTVPNTGFIPVLIHREIE